MIASWKRSCVCFVDAGLAALGCQDEVYLVVNLPIRGMPGFCPRQLMGMGSVGKGELVVFFSNSNSLHPLSFASPSVGIHQGLIWYSDRLELQVYSSWEPLL